MVGSTAVGYPTDSRLLPLRTQWLLLKDLFAWKSDTKKGETEGEKHLLPTGLHPTLGQGKHCAPLSLLNELSQKAIQENLRVAGLQHHGPARPAIPGHLQNGLQMGPS